MNAAQQYIDLFRENRDLIDKHSSAILNGRREAAIRDFELLGLPGKNLEEFLHTDVESFYAPDYGLNLARIKPAENIRETFRCAVPDLESRLYFFIGDTFCQGTNVNLPEGVIACSLCEAAAQHPELVDRYYGKLAQTDKDGTVALNTAVVLEEGAQVRLLSCDHTLDKGNFLTSTVNEIFIGANATFDYYDLEESTLNTHRVSSTFIQQESASNVLVNGITLHNGYTRNNYYITLAGEHAETHLYGMAVADKRQLVDNFTFIDHKAPYCTSDELFKYVLEDSATGIFNGRILVRQGAQKTSAVQTNRNLCTTKEAHIYTQPQLEIYADDVKCSHGATVGQLDGNALFYMRSRGIPESEARMLLMVAFTHDVIEKVRIEKLKERLHKMVERRFRGALDKCAGCRICQ